MLALILVAGSLALSFAVSRSPGRSAPAPADESPVALTRFADGRVDIRSGPGAGYEVINYLSDMQAVLVGGVDPLGWAPILDPVGDTIGFVWARSLLERLPPGRHQLMDGLGVAPGREE